MRVKHLSLDIWGTLFKSNPNYSKVRARRLFLDVVGSEPTEGDIVRICEAYDSMMKVINEEEKTGCRTIPMKIKHTAVLHKLGYSLKVYDSHFYQTEIMQDIFIRNRPYLIHRGIPRFMTDFEDRNNSCTLVISNTGYISGKVLREVMEGYGFNSRSMRCYFTDENPSCKPSIVPFRQMYSKPGIDINTVMHVGDSDIMDMIPAYACGAQTFKIEGEGSWNSLFKLLS